LAPALLPQYQKAQVTTALGDFQSSLAKIQSYAPEFQTERAVAFMLDLANQHGDPGAQSIYQIKLRNKTARAWRSTLPPWWKNPCDGCKMRLI
jgi:hypothetical protein